MKDSSLFTAFGLISLITIARITVNFGGEFQLFFDEAQYWTWAKALDFGYFSKPPIIAWLISLSTSICGDGVGCIKLSAPLLHASTAILVYFSALRLYNTATAFWASILYISLPGVTGGSAFISSDSPLMFCWALALYSFIRVLESNKNHWWLLLGLACGLGMMSKYTMVVFYISTCIFLLSHKKHRHILFSSKAWMSVAISALLFFPNIWWNITHDFISLSHTNENVLDSGRFTLHIQDTIEFIIAQCILFGPLLFLYLMRYSHKTINRKTPLFLLAIFTFTLLIIAIIVSLIAGAQAHWAAPIYISGCILISHLALENTHKWVLKYSTILHIIIMILFFNINTITSIYNAKHNPLERVALWNDAAQHMRVAQQQNPHHIIAADERKAVAILMYHLRSDNAPHSVIKWNIDNQIHDYYDMTTDMAALKNKKILLLTRTNGAHITPFFKSSDIYEAFTIGKHHFKILQLGGFKK